MESKTHTIAGYNYTITQLGSKTGRAVLARLTRLAAGAATKAVTMAVDDANEDAGTLAAVAGIASLISNLSDADLEFYCDTFAKTTMVGKVETPDNQVPLAGVFDAHFAGRYGAMMKWLLAALETNYASFLDEMGLDIGALVEKAKAAMSKSTTPASPTALSGASSSPASPV